MSKRHNIYYDYLIQKLEPKDILENAQNKLNNSGINETDISILEGYLNAMFYPKDLNKKNVTNNLINGMNEYLTKTLKTTINNFDFSKSSYDIDDAKNAEQILELTTRESFKHTKYIYYDTVKIRMEKAMAALNDESIFNPKNSALTVKQIEAVRKDLKEVIDLSAKILRNAEKEYQIVPEENFQIKIPQINGQPDVQSEIYKNIAKLDEAYRKITYFSSIPFSRNQLGLIFEKGLQAIGEQQVNLGVNEIENYLMKAITAGSKNVNRGMLDITTQGIESKNLIQPNINKKVYKYVGENGSIFTISDTFKKKQSKMDVEFKHPMIANSDKKFRISAKNWSQINLNHDFGETSILSGILRTTTQISAVFSYGAKLSTKARSKKNNNIAEQNAQIAHKYARACLLVDILMGYSQKEGYADTIVINDRLASKIKVYSIANIIEDNDSLNRRNFKNYKEKNIENSLRTTKDFRIHTLSVLSKIKIALLPTILPDKKDLTN